MAIAFSVASGSRHMGVVHRRDLQAERWLGRTRSPHASVPRPGLEEPAMRVLKSAFAACVFVTYFSSMILLSAIGMRLIHHAMTPPPSPFL
jgi:hypothetical protein